MSVRGHDTNRDGKPAEVKGTMVRSLAAEIVERRLADAVAAKVSPEARALLTEPPLATEWIDARYINELYEALYQQVGADELCRINRAATDRGVTPYVKAAAESVMRLFGVSPPALLSRLDRVAGTTARGVLYHYDPISETSGSFEIEYVVLRDVPPGPFIATAGALQVVFDMCGVKGSFDDPHMVPNGRNNRMRFKASWRPLHRK